MGVPTKYLPSDAPVITWAYEIAQATVNPVFRRVPNRACPPLSPPQSIIYTQMTYNLGGNNLVNWAPDVPDLFYKTLADGEQVGYFQFFRQNFGLNGFTPGVVSATYDQGTGTTLTVPESLKNLTIADLQLTKTPWGRTYLGLAQSWNQPWGIS
jgi:hypothetical protein